MLSVAGMRFVGNKCASGRDTLYQLRTMQKVPCKSMYAWEADNNFRARVVTSVGNCVQQGARTRFHEPVRDLLVHVFTSFFPDLTTRKTEYQSSPVDHGKIMVIMGCK
mmetsp:Transcript_3212/g.7426  ORF Transcript_3212/g.7426 Transcript_3212/m.7426 type:complete len:108 (+) Transcript_3212:957-1280(+)